MEAKAKAVGEVLQNRNRWEVPIYQRRYAWEEKSNIAPFFEDLIEKAGERIGGKERRFDHYMGALIFGSSGKVQMGKVPAFPVIDGQQRLTTFCLFFAAVRALALDLGFSSMADKLRSLLLNGDEHLMERPEVERFKLSPTRMDREDFEFLMEARLADLLVRFPAAFFQNGRIKTSADPKSLQGWYYFYQEALKFCTLEEGDPKVRELRLDALWRTLAEDFKIVTIELSADDDPQVIFATLNARGEPLAAMDLVRNDIYHRASRLGAEGVSLYEQKWGRFELPWWSGLQKQGRLTKKRLDFFLGNLVIAETGREVSVAKLFPEYRVYSREVALSDVATELDTLSRYAPVYAALNEANKEHEVSDLGAFLRLFDVTTAHPLVLYVAGSAAPKEERHAIFELIKCYVVRRALCGLTTKNFNNNFLRMLGAVRKNGVSVSSLMATFAVDAAISYSLPGDELLRSELQTQSTYTSIPRPALRWILCEMELAARDKFDEDVSFPAGLEVEHILPQSWRTKWPLKSGGFAPAKWSVEELALGESTLERNEIRLRDAAIHNLGNLTLLTKPANAQLSNDDFETKKTRLSSSLLKLNRAVAENKSWDVDDINGRAKILAELAIKRWPLPVEPA